MGIQIHRQSVPSLGPKIDVFDGQDELESVASFLFRLETFDWHNWGPRSSVFVVRSSL